MNYGIDLGGTKIECVIVDDHNSVLFKSRLPTEQQQGYNHIISQIKKLVEMGAKVVGHFPKKVGICTPGSTDAKTGLMKNSNTVVLNQTPFLADVTAALNCAVRMENDANCFALAEHKMGIVRELKPDARVTFGVILGTGVGGGLVVHDQIVTGPNGIAGEWGHNVLEPKGGVCYCGKIGCVECLIAGPSLQRYYLSLTGETLSLQDIYGHYTEGQEAAVKTIDRLIDYFGRGLSIVVNILDPDIIVVGGGVSNIPELYTSGLESLRKNVFNPAYDVILTPAKLGDSAGVYGAAFL